MDYYSILEVPKTVSADGIKKSYRRLALKWHPDKNPENQDIATLKFKEISEAYEILSDEKKRRIYDEYGHDGLKTTNGGPSRSSRSNRRHYRSAGGFDSFNEFEIPVFGFRDPMDVFREFFGGNDPFEDFLDPFSVLMSGGRRSRHHATSHQQSHHPIFNGNPLSAMMSPFGAFGGMGFGGSPFEALGFGAPSSAMLLGGMGGMQTSFSSSSMMGGGPGFSGSSVSTRYVDGKVLTTKKTINNGVETVQVYENDALISETVNGDPAIGGGRTMSAISSSGNNRSSPYSRHAARHRHS